MKFIDYKKYEKQTTRSVIVGAVILALVSGFIFALSFVEALRHYREFGWLLNVAFGFGTAVEALQCTAIALHRCKEFQLTASTQQTVENS